MEDWKPAWACRFDCGKADDNGCAWFETELNEQIASDAHGRIELTVIMDRVALEC